jgi:hypothetical protein
MDKSKIIEKKKRKNKLIAASKKASAHSLKENRELEATLEDGIKNN